MADLCRRHKRGGPRSAHGDCGAEGFSSSPHWLRRDPDEINHLLELTDPELTGLVFDSAHYAYNSREYDVLKGLGLFKERVWYIRFKDCQPEVTRKARKKQWD